MDNHGSQKTTVFRELMALLSIIPAYTPADCTVSFVHIPTYECSTPTYCDANCFVQDVVAPVDHHVGAHMKSIVAKFFAAEMEVNQDQWESKNLPAGCRRMLMAQWVVLAWSYASKNPKLMRQAFVSTGFLLAKDGSEDSLIKMAGLPDDFKYRYQ